MDKIEIQRKRALDYYYKNKEKRYQYYLQNKDKIREYNTNYKRINAYENKTGYNLSDEEKINIINTINNDNISKKLNKINKSINKNKIFKGNLGDIIPFIKNKEIKISTDINDLTIIF